MERVLRGDEKVRKAEEIYYRRKMGINDNKPFEESKKTYLGSKIAFELLVILNVAIIIVAIQNKEFIFTSDFLSMISDYNVNLTQSIKSLLGTEDVTENEVTENVVEDNVEELEQNVLNTENDIVPNTEDASSISQMELDIEAIKQSYSFEKPIEGTVTSLFGARESVYQNVTGYHTGIDIGAEKGTTIKSASSGKVVLVSSKGDYGKHLKIEDGDMQTLYAHCSKILVKEGDYINIGQEIALVGSTGNSTGPHLHFEIRYNERFVDPSKIISF
jgi:murein DD-endopeptidase MepM/ murein hydrolase activator NlpD